MNKLETARRLARQTAGQRQGTEKEKQEVLQTLDYIGKTLLTIREEQKVLSRNQQIIAEGTQKKLATVNTGITTMENTLTTLVKQQQRTRRLLMAIFFTGIVPLLVFITALVLKLWILT